MTLALYLAAFLTVAIGVAHSYLGERYILTRLFRRPDLPKLFGSEDYTKRTLRFAWHVTSIAWWGLAAALLLLTRPQIASATLAAVLAATFLATSAAILVGSRGRHLAWPIFLVIGLITLAAI